MEQPAQSQGKDKDVDDQQGRAETARRPAADGFRQRFDHRDLELPGQEEDGQAERTMSASQLPERLASTVKQTRQFRGRSGLAEEVRKAAENPVGDEQPDRQEGDELDHRLEGDSRHHALVAFRGVQVAGAKEDGEHRHHGGDGQRRIGPPGFAGIDRIAEDDVEARRNRLQLQGNEGTTPITAITVTRPASNWLLP